MMICVPPQGTPQPAPDVRPLDELGAVELLLKRSTGHTHTHTPTENNTPDTDTHAHDNNNTPNPQTNTSHTHLITLEGGIASATTPSSTNLQLRVHMSAPSQNTLFSVGAHRSARFNPAFIGTYVLLYVLYIYMFTSAIYLYIPPRLYISI